MDTVRTFIRELAALAAVIAVAVLAYHGSISGDAAAAILGAVAGATVTGVATNAAAANATNAERERNGNGA